MWMEQNGTERTETKQNELQIAYFFYVFKRISIFFPDFDFIALS